MWMILLLFFKGPPSLEELQVILEVLREFGDFSGLWINFSKMAAVVENMPSVKWAEALPQVGVSVKQFV